MPLWFRDSENREQYRYTVRVLKDIARNRLSAYQDGIDFNPDYVYAYPFGIAEYISDFDTALNRIGWGVFSETTEYAEGWRTLRPLRYFGRLQILVLAHVYRLYDADLNMFHFENIPRLRGYAYSKMVRYLNGIRTEWGLPCA